MEMMGMLETVLLPAGDWYSKLGAECVGVGCSVDAFLFPNSFMDFATIGNIVGITGGSVFKYNYFQVNHHAHGYSQL